MRQKTAVESERPRRSSADEYLAVKSANASGKVNPSGVAMLMYVSSQPSPTEKVEQRDRPSVVENFSIALPVFRGAARVRRCRRAFIIHRCHHSSSPLAGSSGGVAADVKPKDMGGIPGNRPAVDFHTTCS